jgi:hypothetical protein
MTKHIQTGRADTQSAGKTAKQRHCLRCDAVFISEWAGERICSHCKGSSAWRKGSPLGNLPLIKKR